MIINPGSINDLLTLMHQGVPVTMTSHPGNASLYKLSLWTAGIPEHLWDVTCVKADANNWPLHELKDGKRTLLVSEAFYERVLRETSPEKRFVTAYQRTNTGDRLGRHHVRAMQHLFPGQVKTCSHLLLQERTRVAEMFAYLAETRDDVFTRYVDEEGVMRPIQISTLRRPDYATTFMRLLVELDLLLNHDAPVLASGGACYDGVMVPLAGMLVQYWQTGEVVRCDVSGPDMIHYATRPQHVAAMHEMLNHLRKWSTTLVPKRFHVHMFPGTLARVGHIPGHVSEKVMKRKLLVLRNGNGLEKEEKRSLWEEARHDNGHWPTWIDAKKDEYFSQYDLAAQGGKLIVDDHWKSIPIPELKYQLDQANALLRVK